MNRTSFCFALLTVAFAAELSVAQPVEDFWQTLMRLQRDRLRTCEETQSRILRATAAGLESDDAKVRLFSLQVLGEAGTAAKRYAANVEARLNDDDELVRQAAKSTLQRIATPTEAEKNTEPRDATKPVVPKQ